MYRILSILPLLLSVVFATECPNGFLPHYNSCHAPILDLAGWAEARQYCAAMGAELSRVERIEEQHYLEGLLSRYKGNYWIGGLDFLEEGVFMWDNTLQPIGQTFWAPGEPSGSNCLLLLEKSHYKWADEACPSKQHFVCEMPAGAPPLVG
ncbi:perlucin-like [Gigantopelta aegis]|uniref:perlucin-like n=1 Tax=Gigantopelta aegis TaxID=1735272 RepID=UPI001B887532|nr:perlucin-like [Gigantopelta aegis]